MRLLRLCTLAIAGAALAACSDTITDTPIGGPAFEARLAPVTPLRTPELTARTWSRTVDGGPVVDSITGVVSFAKPLDGRARYRFYVVNGIDASALPVAHVQIIERTDSTLDANGSVQTSVATQNRGLRDYYSGGNYATRLRYRVTFSPTDSVQQAGAWLVVTIQADSTLPAYTAATPKPLWVRFRDQRGTATRSDDSVLVADTLRGSFGTFRTPLRQEVFAARGSGRATFWDIDSTSGQRPILSLDASDLPRPPLGYFWQPYLVDARTGVTTPVGLLRNATGASLFNADTVGADSVIAVARATYAPAAAARPIREFTALSLRLEPKTASFGLEAPVIVPGITSALSATIPAPLTSQRPGDGTLRVLVRRGVQAGTPEPNVGIAVLGAGADFNTFLASRNTDASGTASFTGIPAGRVRVVIIAPAGRTVVPPSEQTVTVPSGSDVTVTFVVN